MTRAAPDKLSALPGLFKALTERPCVPLTRGRLPVRNALYVFYEYGEPLLAGSPPHLDEIRLLAPSFRAGFALRMGDGEPPADARPPFKSAGPTLGFSMRASPPIEARWIEVEDSLTRLMLEIYAARKLGLTITNPRLRDALSQLDLAELENAQA